MISNDVLIIDWTKSPEPPDWAKDAPGIRERLFEFAQAVTELKVSYEINGCAELSVKIADYKMEMWNSNYFQIGTPVLFKGKEVFEIATTEIEPSEGEYVSVSLQLRPQAVQQMKRNRTPQSFRSTTGFEFARKVAREYKLEFIGEEPKGIKQAAIKVKSKNNRESVYDVLQRAASDISFLCFVTDGKMFFGSPNWLLGRWGVDEVEGATVETYLGKKVKRTLKYIPLVYRASTTEGETYLTDRLLRFHLLEMPNMRRSEDSPKESEGKASLWFGDGYETGSGAIYTIRAGMTVSIFGIKGFEQEYLITSVEYLYGQPEPIEIAFATIDKLAPADKKKINQKVSEETVISGTGG